MNMNHPKNSSNLPRAIASIYSMNFLSTHWLYQIHFHLTLTMLWGQAIKYVIIDPI